MSFHVGQKVVCVDDTWLDAGWSIIPAKPRRGCVYTIRWIGSYVYNDGLAPVVRLSEIVNPEMDWIDGREEIGFLARRFRPVKQTSIEIFQQMLVNPKVDA